MFPGLSIKWTGRPLVIHDSEAVQIYVHIFYSRRCLYVAQLPGSVKNLNTIQADKNREHK